MRNISFLIPSIFLLMLVGVVIGVTILSADEATVQAEVRAQQLSVSVTDGTVNYGSLALGATQDTNALPDPQFATNNGNLTEKLNIRGATSDAWALTTGTPTGEQYRHRFATDGGTVWTALTTSNQTLIASIAENATQDFDLEIMMSNNTTATATQDVDVTVQATTP